ncbi:MAG TPA: stage III sporulation protein AF [Candidatus Eisenbergiella merdigallinarum]|uniref:Stage III sporulation protein AF n=1 Tax=Candidatus Eisenbergiella merdigallinarum TaxID=2838552 RepID=A0A9D2MQ72_9FIRM|nr:stage III sporulation protein AF [Candidatus Eisenbergiella merdigallinarum]
MMEELLSVLKETAIFMLASQLILHFAVEKQYEKYGKMIAALIVLAQLAVPVLSLFRGDLASGFFQKMDRLEAENEIFSRELEEMEGMEGALVEEGLFSSVEQRLEGEAAAAGVRVSSVELSGDVLRIGVENASGDAPSGEGPEGARENGEIASVRVDPVTIGEESAQASGAAGVNRQDLARRFAAALGMEEQEVEVIGLG